MRGPVDREVCVIVIPTHSKYYDICCNFLAVLKKSWSDCRYRVLISVCGENVNFNEYETIFNGNDATLTECIINAADYVDSDYYMVFLGDAFISRTVKNDEVNNLIHLLKKMEVEYCCLWPKKAYEKVKMAGDCIRYINVKDRYSHSFVAFAVTKHFLEEEFRDGEVHSDYEFELKYLELANKTNCPWYYRNRTVVTKDIFHIMAGIKKGKWDRLVLRDLKKHFPEIAFAYRPKLSITEQLWMVIRQIFLPVIPGNMRKSLKRLLLKMAGNRYFDTMN